MPFDPWDVKQIENQAPDDKSIPAARKVLQKGGFERIESRADGTGWWAVCRGLTDVYNVTATRGPTGTVQSDCTCPSPKRPCKHALALLLHLAAHPELRPDLTAADAPKSDTLEGLIAAVFASPDDDLPRLVFADYLEENGEADRAALIRVSCELAKKRLPAERKKALQAEEKRLTAATLGGPHGLLPLGSTYEIRRGFVWLTLPFSVVGSTGAQPASMLRLFQTGAVETITIPGGVRSQADLDIARYVRRLDLCECYLLPNELVHLAANLRPGLAGVRLREVLVPEDDRAEYKKLLAGGGPPLSELKNPTAARIRELAAERRFRTAYSLTVTGATDDALTALAEVPDLRGLAILELQDTAATAAGLIAVGNSTHLRKLASVGIEGGRLTDADFAAVGREAAFPALHQLALNRLHLTDATLITLARGPAFARLDDVTLDDLPVTPAGLRRFVADAPALECLGVGDLTTPSLLPLVFTRGTRRMQVDSSEGSITWEPAERTLGVNFADDVPAGFFAAVAKWPKGVRVDRIIFGSTFADGVFAELLDFLALGRIPRVDLSGLGLRNAEAVALAARLAELAITHLDLSENKIGMTGAKALAESPGLAKVVSLDLRNNPILKSGRTALAASPHKTALKEINLHVHRERVDAAEVRELRKAFGKGVKVGLRATS